jgi:chromosome segregation ATPase
MTLALNSTSWSEHSQALGATEEGDGETAIRAANQELQRRAGSALDLPLTVLVEQRNRALREVQAARAEALRARKESIEEQDRFIAFLMADYERQVVELQRELERAREAQERRRLLEPVASASNAAAGEREPFASGSLENQIASLQDQLQAAYSEVDDTRSDATRLQEERDDAIRETSDVRYECQKQVELARDEATQLQWQLDEAERRLEDASDQARDEAYALSEQIDEARRELDERTAEVRSLHARLATLDEEIQTRPPPSAAIELENARKEAQLLRKSLIEAKREASRVKNELESVRARAGLLGAPDEGAVTPRRSEIQRRS